MLWWTLRQLRSEDAVRRIEAIRRLSGSRNARALAALVEMLDDPAEPIVSEAEKALIAAGQSAVGELLGALGHPSDRRKVHAARTLRAIVADRPAWEHAREVTAALALALAGADAGTRRMAAAELGAQRAPAALKPLAVALCDRDAGVRRAALESLGAFLAAQPSPLDPAPTAESLDAVPALVEAMRHHQPSEGEYEIAARMIARLGSHAVQPLLLLLAQAGKESAKVAAIEALGILSDPKCRQPLLEALKDRSPAVRLSAARALGKFRSPGVEYALESLLKDGDIGVRMAAAESLLKIVPARRIAVVVPTLQHVIRNEATAQRQRAATLLGNIPDARAAAELVEALGDKEQEVRKAAEEALVKLGTAIAGDVIRALRHKSPEVRRAAARILGRIGAPAAVEPLLAALRDSDEWVRAHAAEVLRKLGDQRVIPAFLAALDDGNERVREHAAAVLGELGDPQQIVVPLLRAARQGKSLRACVGALIAVMALRSAEVGADDLRAMAEFTAASPDGRPQAAAPEDDINCSALRQLAREELTRRGLPLP